MMKQIKFEIYFLFNSGFQKMNNALGNIISDEKVTEIKISVRRKNNATDSSFKANEPHFLVN